MTDREGLEREIERLKWNLSAYLSLAPQLDITDEERQRVINQFLDDILARKEKLKIIDN